VRGVLVVGLTPPPLSLTAALESLDHIEAVMCRFCYRRLEQIPALVIDAAGREGENLFPNTPPAVTAMYGTTSSYSLT
jgi:hypothetical protein